MRLKPGARVFLAIVVLVLIGAGAYRLGWLNPVMKVIAPERKPAGKVEQTDFSFAKTEPSGGEVPKSGAKLDRPIRVAIVLWGGYAGGIMENGGFTPNRDCAFFKNHGIQVELVQIDDFAESRNAFRAGGEKGGVDIMWGTVDSYALEYGSLAELRPVTIMQYDWSRGGDAIAVAKGINNASDLRGKRISVAQATPSHFFLLYMLAQANLSTDAVTLVFTNSAIEAAQVFKAGKVDACVSWSPDVYIAADSRPGAHILASTREATHLIADIFIARGDFVERYPAEAVSFISGWLEGVDAVHANPDQAAQLMQKSFTGITLKDSEGMLSDVKLPDAAENREFFGLQGHPVIGYDELYSAASRIWRKVGLVTEVSRPEVTRNITFLDQATQKAKGTIVASAEEFKFAPPTQQTEKKAPIVTKRISVYFATGSSTLDDNARSVLEQAAELAQTFGSTYIRVSGNTDSKGSRDMNMELSRKRAQAVVDYLIAKYQFPRDKFMVVGNGPDKPVAGNDSEEGRAQNRRTDFEVIPQEQK